MKRSILALFIGLLVGIGAPILTATAHTDARVPADVIDYVHGYQSTGFTIRMGSGRIAKRPPIRTAYAECADGLDTEGRDAYMRCIGYVRAEYAMYAAMRKTLDAKGVNR